MTLAACTHCDQQIAASDAFCSACGAQQIRVPATAAAPRYDAAAEADANTIRQIADYERISGYVWIVFGIIQILSLFGIVAGIWNIFAGRSRLKVAPHIMARNKAVPEVFDGIGSLVVIGIVNVLLGGVIGVVFVGFDFFIRDKVLSNRRLFCNESPRAA